MYCARNVEWTSSVKNYLRIIWECAAMLKKRKKNIGKKMAMQTMPDKRRNVSLQWEQSD